MVPYRAALGLFHALASVILQIVNPLFIHMNLF